MNLTEKKRSLINELTEGYKVTRFEDKQLISDWDITSGDGID